MPAEVYGGILAGAVEAFLPAARRTDDGAVEEVQRRPDASDADIDQAPANVEVVNTFVAYDVGRGTALGLLDGSEDVRLFFALGGGAYGNRKTRRTRCASAGARALPIVLSHLDTDH